MLINVPYAECDGCGRRVESDTIPPHWLSVSRGSVGGARVFCRASCFGTTEGFDAHQLAAYRAHKFLLAPRDVAIIGLVAQGKSNCEIAQALGISVITVKNRLSKNCAKRLGASSRIEVVLLADRLGLIDMRAQAETIVQRFPTVTESDEPEEADGCLDPDHTH